MPKFRRHTSVATLIVIKKSEEHDSKSEFTNPQRDDIKVGSIVSRGTVQHIIKNILEACLRKV